MVPYSNSSQTPDPTYFSLPTTFKRDHHALPVSSTFSGFSPLPMHCVTLCRKEDRGFSLRRCFHVHYNRAYWRKGGPWGRIIRPQESLAPYKSFNTLCVSLAVFIKLRTKVPWRIVLYIVHSLCNLKKYCFEGLAWKLSPLLQWNLRISLWCMLQIGGRYTSKSMEER
jgi:hypothetical protein